MDGTRKSKMPEELHIKHAANKGFVVTHRYDNRDAGPSYQPPTEHVFVDHASMMAHVHKHTHQAGMSAAPSVKGKSVESEKDADRHGQKKHAAPAPGPPTFGAGVD